ncbi:nucleotidyltransferase [Candidatus Margulisiibacteriota bacterium]
MVKYSEETLNNWRKPPSDTEEDKLSNAESMIRDAINNDSKLKDMDIEIFGQGSYANDTNVKLNSDIDINVRYTGGFFYHIPEGKDKSDFGLNSPSTYSYSEFKNDVVNALLIKFSSADVNRDDKCITIKGNNYRVKADVVPTWEYRWYLENGSYVKGTMFMTDRGIWITNYPIQHIENGKIKNNSTQKRYKRLTRIFKRILYKMIDDKYDVNDNITSFLLECLVWNVPNNKFNDYNTWTERLKESIRYLYDNTKEQDGCKNWGEVSKQQYLFHNSRKWSRADVNRFLISMWNFMGY